MTTKRKRVSTRAPARGPRRRWIEMQRRPSGLLRLYDSRGQSGLFSYFQTQDVVSEMLQIAKDRFEMRERYEDKPPVYIHENGDYWESFKVASIVFARLVERAEKEIVGPISQDGKKREARPSRSHTKKNGA